MQDHLINVSLSPLYVHGNVMMKIQRFQDDDDDEHESPKGFCMLFVCCV